VADNHRGYYIAGSGVSLTADHYIGGSGVDCWTLHYILWAMPPLDQMNKNKMK